jgi:sugar O-acyltransferase (sialic acid O-acetyltransferase NeuD family)
MKKCLVLGAGGHCRALLSILQEKCNYEYQLQGIVDTQPVSGDESILGVKIIGSVNDLSSYFSTGIIALFLAIGDNHQRALFYNKAKKIGFELPNLIAGDAHITPTALLGDGNLVCHGTHMGPMSRIGNGNILNTGSILEHESTIADFCHIAPSAVISGRSHLGSFVFLGVNATVIDKITVCDNVTIGAGAVVVQDLNCQNATYVGVPARKLKKTPPED